jgi:hypothetical protein
MSRLPDGSSPKHDVVVDLADLVSIGQVLLPALANDYATLNHTAADTAQQGGRLFGWQPGGGSDSMGDAATGTDQIRTQWSALCQLLQNAFGHSATNLQDATTTLLAIERHYQSTDHVSAGDLKKVWDSEVWPQDKGYQPSYPRVQVTETD